MLLITASQDHSSIGGSRRQVLVLISGFWLRGQLDMGHSFTAIFAQSGYEAVDIANGLDGVRIVIGAGQSDFVLLR